MVAGDAVVQLTAGIANNAYFTYQPAVGVETELRHFGGSEEGLTIAINFNLFNGADNAELYTYDRTAVTNPRGRLSIFVTNSVYAHIENTSGGARAITITGVQTR